MKNNKVNKRALIVSPYLNHLGGGERYMLTIGAILENQGYTVHFSHDDLKQLKYLAKQLSIKLTHPHLDSRVRDLYFNRNPLLMYSHTTQYDLVFYLIDGSIPLLGGKKNILHMQVPFSNVNGQSWFNRLKLLKIDEVIVNSEFTSRIVDTEYGIHSTVLYPPVNLLESSSKKKKLILSVGRFEPSLNIKKQNILIEAFSILSKKFPDWKLLLLGSSEGGGESLVSDLKKSLPANVTILSNISYQKLASFYQQATIYWHGAGYKEDEDKSPELTEHFGITTIEAISAGCIPLVVPKGGQKEILEDKLFHWETIPDLVSKTTSLIENKQQYKNKLSKLDIARYGKDRFAERIIDLIK